MIFDYSKLSYYQNELDCLNQLYELLIKSEKKEDRESVFKLFNDLKRLQCLAVKHREDLRGIYINSPENMKTKFDNLRVGFCDLDEKIYYDFKSLVMNGYLNEFKKEK